MPRRRLAPEQLPGWAAAAAGFTLANDLPHRDGRARRLERRDPLDHHVPRDERSIANVIFGGFGTADAKAPAAGPQAEAGAVIVARRRRVDAARSKSVVIVPGYGMAVARAQGAGPRPDARAPGARDGHALRGAPRRGAPAGSMNVLLEAKASQ